jgi:hypothetical protein
LDADSAVNLNSVEKPALPYGIDLPGRKHREQLPAIIIANQRESICMEGHYGGSKTQGTGRKTENHKMIRKLKSGQYRLYSRKKDRKTGRRRNLGTFKSRAAAEKHERAVQYFKHH